MTAEEFSKHENNRVQLATLLTSPILQQAIVILKAELEPKANNDGVVNPVVGAARFQQIAGANHIVAGLERLTRAPKPPTRTAMKELLPEPPLPHI